MTLSAARRSVRVAALLVAAGAALAACGLSGSASPGPVVGTWDWSDLLERAQGQEVSLWMWGGDRQGNSYVDDVLAPAAAELGVTVRRVPIADTQDAITRMLAEAQAGREDGSIDLVWVNGENFRSGQQAGLWRCGWADQLPNARYLDSDDRVLAEDFGTPVDACEVPWHRAQFVLAYDAEDVDIPPTTLAELYAWVRANPGRFTYPAPPDFTGSAFLRQALYDSAPDVPAAFDAEAFGGLTAPLWDELSSLEPSLWREGRTYPRDVSQLDRLFADDQVSFTMTYGPATLDALVADGNFPESTRVLPLAGGTIGNASFLATPANASHPEGAMVVADLALSPEQQLAKADPERWGQYTVLDLDRIPADDREQFQALPASTVVPPFAELSQDARPELSAEWVAPLERAWRQEVLIQ